MSDRVDEPLAAEGRLLFGAGFVFGVMFTMVILAVVVATVAAGTVTLDGVVTSSIALTVLAGIVFAAIVGAGLYLLAFPENRIEVPLNPGETADADDGESDESRG